MAAWRMKIICAYPANIDAVCTISGEMLSRMIAASWDFKIELKPSIKSREDLLSSLLYCMKQGSGAEVLIEDRGAALQIGSDEAFSWRFRLGGNAAIMASVLAALGAEPVLNAPALSTSLAGLLHPQVRLPWNGSLLDPCRAAWAKRADRVEEMVHFVFQFQEGEAVAAGKAEFLVPQANRFIATYDPVNSRLLTSPDFDSYCTDNIKRIAGALVSGYHLCPESQRADAFARSAAQITSWRQRNPGLFIHAEMGSISSASTMNSLLMRLSRIPVDSVGLNEDEIAVAQQEDPALPAEWPHFLRSAEGLRRRLGLFRVAVHTRDFILSVMKVGRISPLAELSALQSGTDAAASLAATGSPAGEIADPSARVSSAGRQALQMLCQMNGSTKSGRGVYLISGDLMVSLMPSLLVREPKFTVGLGDTATAAIFLRELSVIN